MPYTPTVYVNGTTPAINATNLNKLRTELVSQASARGVSNTLSTFTWANGVAPPVSGSAELNEMERVAAAVAATLSLSYTATTWSSGWTPPRNATNLNKLENAAQANRAALDALSGPTAPTAPLSLSVSPGNAQNALSWSAPASNGGSAVTGYKVYRSTTAGAEVLFASPAGTGTTYTNTGLTNGTIYFYKVTAVNAVGESVQSNEASGTPSGATGTPVLVVDFETGDFSQSPTMSQQESSSGRISLVAGSQMPGGVGGNWTAKTLIGPPDQGVAGSGGSYRTEMAVAVLVDYFGGSLQGKHTWITWDHCVDPNFEFSGSDQSWMLFMQLWTTGLETGSPCCTINVLQGQQYVTLRGGDAFGTNTRVYGPMGAVLVNQRVRWKIHHLWSSSGSSGLVQIYRNGTLLASDNQPNSAPGNDSAVEFKCGVYRSGTDPPSRDSYVLHDNIKFWTADPGPSF